MRSVIVLLRPQADLANVTGTYERGFEGQEPHITFRYQVIRVWQLPAERLLAGGLGTLPLAPISAVKEADLPRVLARMKERLSTKRVKPRAARLWTATYVLMGLRYSNTLANQLLQEVLTMEESVTYQAIVRKGRIQEARRLLQIFGRKHFGEPPAEVIAALDAIQDVSTFEELAIHLEEVDSWHKLLDLPILRARSRRRKEKP